MDPITKRTIYQIVTERAARLVAEARADTAAASAIAAMPMLKIRRGMLPSYDRGIPFSIALLTAVVLGCFALVMII